MRQFGLIGCSLEHSASVAYFKQMFRSDSITDCEYVLYELSSINGLPGLLDGLPDLCGLNVTIPYKQAIIPFLDDLSFDARCIGAVNCVKRSADGRLAGYNTDIIGLRASLNELLGVAEIKNALILGTGGASQAVQYALTERGIAFALVSRDAAKGNYTYAQLPVEVIEHSKLIINASPVGTYPDIDDAPSIPYAYLTPEHFLLDLVYNPPLTQFLDYGRQRGARIMNGEQMFLAQAEASWRIWNDDSQFSLHNS